MPQELIAALRGDPPKHQPLWSGISFLEKPPEAFIGTSAPELLLMIDFVARLFINVSEGNIHFSKLRDEHTSLTKNYVEAGFDTTDAEFIAAADETLYASTVTFRIIASHLYHHRLVGTLAGASEGHLNPKLFLSPALCEYFLNENPDISQLNLLGKLSSTFRVVSGLLIANSLAIKSRIDTEVRLLRRTVYRISRGVSFAFCDSPYWLWFLDSQWSSMVLQILELIEKEYKSSELNWIVKNNPGINPNKKRIYIDPGLAACHAIIVAASRFCSVRSGKNIDSISLRTAVQQWGVLLRGNRHNKKLSESTLNNLDDFFVSTICPRKWPTTIPESEDLFRVYFAIEIANSAKPIPGNPELIWWPHSDQSIVLRVPDRIHIPAKDPRSVEIISDAYNKQKLLTSLIFGSSTRDQFLGRFFIDSLHDGNALREFENLLDQQQFDREMKNAWKRMSTILAGAAGAGSTKLLLQMLNVDIPDPAVDGVVTFLSGASAAWASWALSSRES